MMPQTLDPTMLEDVVVSLNAQGEVIHIDLHDKRYSDFRVPFTPEQVAQGLENYAHDRGSSDPLVAFGSMLFNAVFGGERGRELWTLLDRVTRANRGLRLRIRTNLERTQHLPWELLYDVSHGDFVALSGRVALVRTRPDDFGLDAQPGPLEQLRVLAVSADPEEALGARADLEALQALVQAQPAPARVRLQTLPDATNRTLERTLAQDKFDVFIFCGTGVLQAHLSKAGGLRQDLQLRAEDADDGRLQRNQLGRWLRNAEVRLAVMNGSHSDWIARSLAKQVPATMGFRESVRRESRAVLIATLWQSLLIGRPLDLAMTDLRQALDRALPGTGEWARLICYLQANHGGILLQAPPAPAAAPTLAASADRQLAKLQRLLQLYRQNLDDLQRRGGAFPEQARQPQIDSLQQQVDALTRHIEHASAAHEPGKASGDRP